MGLTLPRLIGHRGAAATAPENTQAGFRRAATEGAAWVELDVQLSRDGIPVVFHDDTLERTSNGHGRLIETHSRDLAGLDAGSWFGAAFAGEAIPTLEQALGVIAEQGLGVNIEIKADDVRAPETAVVALAAARRVWPQDRPPPLVSSFSRVGLAAALRAAPDWPRGLICDIWPEDWGRATATLECVSLHVHWRQLTKRRIEKAKDAGLQVLTYTVNRAPSALRLWGWGVASIFTDCPGRLLKSAEAHL